MSILEGVLIRPLTVGKSALFLHRGDLVRTSRVVIVHAVSDEEARFETLNTNYRLLTGHTYEPGPAVSQFSMSMAA